jgi:putative membrane protein
MMLPVPVWVHEAVAAPLALALAWLLARRAVGAARASLELAVLVGYGVGLEWTAMAVFASHRYAAAWRLVPAAVPVAVAIVWAALIVSALATAARLGFSSPLPRAAAAAVLGIALDLLMEPVAVRAGLWAWTPPGPWLGVPMGNFVGWAVIVCSYVFGAERWPFAVLGRVALAVVSVAALVGVGVVWRGLGAEALFAGAGGWTLWVVLVASAMALPHWRRGGGGGTSFGSRLAAVGGLLPAVVFLGLALLFALDAVGVGEPRLWPVVAGSVLSLAYVTWKAGSERRIHRDASGGAVARSAQGGASRTTPS